MLRSDPENWALAVADAGEAADQLHADAGERVEVERRALGRSRELHRRHAAGPHDVVDLVVALVEHAGRLHPPVDVATPVHAGPAHVLADGQRDRAARALDLVGDLHAGRRRADDQHAALGELRRGCGTSIGVSVVDRRRHRVGERRARAAR